MAYRLSGQIGFRRLIGAGLRLKETSPPPDEFK